MQRIVKIVLADGTVVEPAVTWAVLSTVFALAGPFGSYQAMGLGSRFFVWSVIVAIAVACALFCRDLLRQMGEWHDRRWGTLAVALICMLLFTWPLYLYAESAFAPQTAVSLPEVAVFVFVCSLRLIRVEALSSRFAESSPLPPEGPPAPPHPRIVQRLDPALQGRLIAISVRNHHVEVSTTAGQGQLLLRLADAMEETEGEEGAQVHRSHWVAWWAVTAAERDGARYLLHLADGTQLPVSRSHREKLEERGLLSAAAANGIARTTRPVSNASAPGPISAASSGAAQDRPPVKLP